jgi:hypothetical protein
MGPPYSDLPATATTCSPERGLYPLLQEKPRESLIRFLFAYCKTKEPFNTDTALSYYLGSAINVFSSISGLCLHVPNSMSRYGNVTGRYTICVYSIVHKSINDLETPDNYKYQTNSALREVTTATLSSSKTNNLIALGRLLCDNIPTLWVVMMDLTYDLYAFRATGVDEDDMFWEDAEDVWRLPQYLWYPESRIVQEEQFGLIVRLGNLHEVDPSGAGMTVSDEYRLEKTVVLHDNPVDGEEDKDKFHHQSVISWTSIPVGEDVHGKSEEANAVAGSLAN